MVYRPGAVAISGGLTGSEIVEVDQGGPRITTVTTQQIAALASLESTSKVITALNTVGAGTVTAAGIVGGTTLRGGAQSATAFTDTTATAAAIVAALPTGAPVGTSFMWRYDNPTDGAATLAGGTGVTVSGNTIVPALTWAEFLVTYTAANTVTIVFVAGGQMCPLPLSQFVTTALESATITVGGLCGSQICNLINTGTTPANLNLPTAAQIFAGIPNCRAGLSYQLLVRNGSGSANTATLTTNTGLTLTGTMTIAQNATRTFIVTIVSATAVTLQSMGTAAGA